MRTAPVALMEPSGLVVGDERERQAPITREQQIRNLQVGGSSPFGRDPHTVCGPVAKLAKLPPLARSIVGSIPTRPIKF